MISLTLFAVNVLTSPYSFSFQPPAKRLKVDIACDSEPNLENDLAITKACFLQELKEREITSRHCGTYWPDDWRAKLCKCSLCKVNTYYLLRFMGKLWHALLK